MANSIVRETPSYAYPPFGDVADWQRDMLGRLNLWVIQMPDHVTGNQYMKTLCEIRYHSVKMLLLRPSPAIPAPPCELLMDCHRSAQRTIRLYNKLYKQELLVHDWIALHGIMLGTITMLYCIRSVTEIALETEAEELMSDTSMSLTILSSIGEYWSSARRARDILEDMFRSTLRCLKSLKRDKQLEGIASTAGTINSIGSIDHLARDGTPNLHERGSFPSSFSLPTGTQTDYSNSDDQHQQQYSFNDITDVDEIMRNLFDSFIPGGQEFDFMQEF